MPEDLGAENELIAEAKLLDDSLVIVACSGDSFTVPLKNISTISKLARTKQLVFELAEDGSYLYWPDADLHLDLEEVRLLLGDPTTVLKAKAAKLSHDERIGRAIAELRQDAGLRQGDIDGLSERQIRRYEHGESPTLPAFEPLAKAHNASLHDYLDRVAERASIKPPGGTARKLSNKRVKVARPR